jgi:hypothetical protein
MSVVREQDLLLVAGPAMDFLMHTWRLLRAADRPWTALPWRAAAAGALAFAIAWAPLLLAYWALNGHAGPTETAARKMTWWSPHAFSVLFSPEHGFLAWTPMAIIAIGGIVVGASGASGSARSVRWVFVAALVMIAAQVYSSGSVESWTVAGAFGQRRFVALTPLLVLGLAALFARVRAPTPRRWVTAAVALSVWWNLGLMAQFGMNLMDRQRLTLADNARVTFVELPFQAPAILWKYLTDRESFYRKP